MKKIYPILLALFLLAFYSCKTESTKTEKKKTERQIVKKTDAQVKADIDSLIQLTETQWNTMIASDDQKLDNLQTLMARIGRDKKYDKKALTDLIAARNQVKAQRYDRQGIANVAAVDAYDSLQIKLMDATNDIVSKSELTQRDTVAASLVNNIQEEDSRVPILRAYYDNAAKAFNQYLLDYQPQLQKLGPPYNTLQRMPLFVEPVVQ
jgi:hypothetical protein